MPKRRRCASRRLLPAAVRSHPTARSGDLQTMGGKEQTIILIDAQSSMLEPCTLEHDVSKPARSSLPAYRRHAWGQHTCVLPPILLNARWHDATAGCQEHVLAARHGQGCGHDAALQGGGRSHGRDGAGLLQHGEPPSGFSSSSL